MKMRSADPSGNAWVGVGDLGSHLPFAQRYLYLSSRDGTTFTNQPPVTNKEVRQLQAALRKYKPGTPGVPDDKAMRVQRRVDIARSRGREQRSQRLEGRARKIDQRRR
jgi:hypothetical protein